MNTATIPVEMQERPNWVLWRVDFVDGKVPYQVNGGKAKSNDPTTWTTLDKAVARYEQGGFDGIGFVFSTDCGLVFVDFDNVRDSDTGRLQPWSTTNRA